MEVGINSPGFPKDALSMSESSSRLRNYATPNSDLGCRLFSTQRDLGLRGSAVPDEKERA